MPSTRYTRDSSGDSQPRLFFSDSQQMLLRHALSGVTDDELSERLFLSRPAVKKRRAGIYALVEGALPEVLFAESEDSPEKGKRGAEKRRYLLCHLHSPPEELRPCSSPYPTGPEVSIAIKEPGRFRLWNLPGYSLCLCLLYSHPAAGRIAFGGVSAVTGIGRL